MTTTVLSAHELADQLKTCKPNTPVCLILKRDGPFYLARNIWRSPSALGDAGEIVLLAAFEPRAAT